MSEAILKEGDTCWRKVQADRVSFIVDAADYFSAAKEAILKAEHSVYMIGWEFDLDIRLRPDVEHPEIPDQLRPFLNHVVTERPDLEIFILQWDGAMLFNIARQLGSFLLLKAQAKPNIHFRLDSTHPVGACHHQKVVVIDDMLAFCGGIDMTSGRWDTPAHRTRDRRRGDSGETPMPWHDMTLALEGEAARVLGELARWRWKNATGHDLPVPSRQGSIWPESLSPDLCGAEVGIARTSPGYDGREEVREIEKLWCTAIASAKRTIYIENQFLASGRIAAALRARLEEEGGPEIVIVLPSSAESWVEAEAMDTARALIVTDLRRADRHGRLGIYHPVTAEGRHIYVHAKLLMIDDDFVRVGSSNMASRSMAFDSECDLAMESVGQPELRDVIARLRTRLLAEHLGMSSQAVEADIQDSGGSVLALIERRRSKSGATLRVLEVEEPNAVERALVESRLLDPEEPILPSWQLNGFATKAFRRNRGALAAGALAAAGLAAAAWLARRAFRTR